MLITQSDEYEGMTATCRDQYDELQRLNDQYNAACEQYGENSDAANSLRYQLDQLNDEFETNRQTVKEFVAECDGLVESHNKVMDAYNSSTSSIKDQELGTLALTQRLGELASQNTQTTASYTEMKAIIDQLNADVPGLGLTYDGVTESVDATVEAIKKAAKAQADSEYKAEQQQTYVDLLKEQSSLEQQIAEAEANLDAERQRRGMRQDDVTGDWVSGSGFWMEDSPWVAWTSDIDDYKKSLEELQAAYDENQQTLSDIEGEWRGVAQAVEDSQNQTVSYEEAVSAAVSTAQTELDNLTAAYDKAYESARTSIEGQIGLFDTMKTSSELSISDMEKAMQSQTDYLNLYSENLKKAAEYGLDDGLIKSLSDGSEESAGYINAIIQRLFEWKISAKPVHLILTGTRVNFYAAIQSLQPYRKGGDPGSIYYKIKLKEYREVRIRQVKVSSTGTVTVSGGSTRTDNRVQAKTYTVKPGDCLYNISKSALGDGGRYNEIYSLNKDKLKNPNLIYPGQVLQLP